MVRQNTKTVWSNTLIFQLPIYLEPGVDRYLIYWQLGAWFQIYGELEGQKYSYHTKQKLTTKITHDVLYWWNSMNLRKEKTTMMIHYKLQYYFKSKVPHLRFHDRSCKPLVVATFTSDPWSTCVKIKKTFHLTIFFRVQTGGLPYFFFQLLK